MLEFRQWNGEPVILDTREGHNDELLAISRHAYVLLKSLDSCRTQNVLVEAAQGASTSEHPFHAGEFEKLLGSSLSEGW